MKYLLAVLLCGVTACSTLSPEQPDIQTLRKAFSQRDFALLLLAERIERIENYLMSAEKEGLQQPEETKEQ